VNRVTPLEHALSTAELLDWGVEGEGEFLTVWVAQYPGVIEHCACQFKIPGHPQERWFMAAHTGTTVGWVDLPDSWVTGPLPYTPRRRP